MSKFSIFRFHNRWKTLKPKDLQENRKHTGYMAIDHGYNFNNSVKAAKANGNMKESDIFKSRRQRGFDVFEKNDSALP
ncbi:MAG: hypothetical protein L6V88_02590 [Anaerotruncus sp.]|nr:MAG: hypothetical protein L6V88_02590 [Anaerotruncus sp.]